MTIMRTAYDTTIGSMVQTGNITKAIKEAFVRDYIYNTNMNLITSLGIRPVFVTGAQSSEGNIPLFSHPILVEDKGAKFLVTDVRPFVRHDQHDGNYDPSIKNIMEYNFAKIRLILNLGWLTGSRDSMRANLKFAATVFAAWISETISKRYSLDPGDQMKIVVASLYFYFCQFEEKSKLDDEDITKLTIFATKVFKMPSRSVTEVIDKIESAGNLDEFCETIKTVTQNIRLNDFSRGVLITITVSSWFATNGKEILSVSLEHPPTWIAIVAAALNERSFRNSMIARVAERYAKGNAGAEFTGSVADLVEYHTVKKQRSASDELAEY